MDQQAEQINRKQLTDRLSNMIPADADVDEAMNGVVLALTPPEDRRLAVRSGIGEPGVVYAWHESDASATKLAFEVLVELGKSFWAGPSAVVNLGIALKELVCFLVDVHQHRVRVSDPLEVEALLLLHREKAGLTAVQIRERLDAETPKGEDPPSLSDIEGALDRLEAAAATSGGKPLVRADGPIWKSLV